MCHQRYWKAVAFDPAMTETDTWWKPDQRERWDELQQRTERFLQWLKGRSEENIVVVTHGVWMECLLRAFLHGRRVFNTDAYGCTLKSEGSSVEITDVMLVHGQR